MRYRGLLVLLALGLLSSISQATSYVATFQSTVSSTTFTMALDDSSSDGYFNGYMEPDDTRWHIYEDYPYFKEDNEAVIAIQPTAFWAVSTHAQGAGFVDMDFNGTNVHVLFDGRGYRAESISVSNVDLSSIDTRQKGWAPKLFGLLSDKVFTARLSYSYDVYEGLAISTDGPLTVQDVYASGSKWFDGIPWADVNAAVSAQYPDFNRQRVEPMRFVSLVPSVPEPEAVALVVAGLGVVGFLRKRRAEMSSTNRSDQ